MTKNDLLLRAARRERTERTPVWFMRQAGRFDPKYRDLRERADLPLEELFRRPDLAAEISLLPRRFGVDAIILFQDILTPLVPMGARFVFRPGPVWEHPIRSLRDVLALRPFDPYAELDFVAAAVKLVRAALDGELPLLGFAGAPLTLAFFLVEGRSPFAGGATHARRMMRTDPSLLHKLLDPLANMTADYLAMQIEAGVDAVQLFESAADLLSPEEYATFAQPYHQKIFARLAGRVPTILFVKDQPLLESMAESGADVLSIGSRVDLADAKRRVGHKVALQGNVDNRLLAEGSLEEIERAVVRCLRAGGHLGHILNLGHGLLADTPVENVRRFIEVARQTRVEAPPETLATG